MIGVLLVLSFLLGFGLTWLYMVQSVTRTVDSVDSIDSVDLDDPTLADDAPGHADRDRSARPPEPVRRRVTFDDEDVDEEVDETERPVVTSRESGSSGTTRPRRALKPPRRPGPSGPSGSTRR